MSREQTAIAVAYETIVYTKKEHVGYITLNRPKVLNALNHTALTELRSAFEDASLDVDIRGVILTGAGDKAFIAGADITELGRINAIDGEQFTRAGQAVLNVIENLGKSVIAAVSGYALGAGCETAMACTIRLATDDAKFGQPEVKLGIIPGYGGPPGRAPLPGGGAGLPIVLSRARRPPP